MFCNVLGIYLLNCMDSELSLYLMQLKNWVPKRGPYLKSQNYLEQAGKDFTCKGSRVNHCCPLGISFWLSIRWLVEGMELSLLIFAYLFVVS